MADVVQRPTHLIAPARPADSRGSRASASERVGPFGAAVDPGRARSSWTVQRRLQVHASASALHALVGRHQTGIDASRRPDAGCEAVDPARLRDHPERARRCVAELARVVGSVRERLRDRVRRRVKRCRSPRAAPARLSFCRPRPLLRALAGFTPQVLLARAVHRAAARSGDAVRAPSALSRGGRDRPARNQVVGRLRCPGGSPRPARWWPDLAVAARGPERASPRPPGGSARRSPARPRSRLREHDRELLAAEPAGMSNGRSCMRSTSATPRSTASPARWP